MDVNQFVAYGFVVGLIAYSVLAYHAHRNMRNMIKGLDKEKHRMTKLENHVSELDRDVKHLKHSMAQKVERRSLERIFAETIEFIERNSAKVAVAQTRVPAKRS
ncbi:hypothetical protein KJ765_00485 [Candidatus Micrarchaeota archaeon]|nr:hypothetical protein [Candidatus Micrarchaeota archaeon]